MGKIITFEEAQAEYADYFQQNKHKCIKETGKLIFKAGKVAEYVGIMAKGASRRFYISKNKDISYNFYYKHIGTAPNLFGESIIPHLSLVNNLPELFNLELIETKIIIDSSAFLMPIAEFRKDMEQNKRLRKVVDVLIMYKLKAIATRYTEERICKNHKQKRIEHVAKLYSENHHIFANGILDIHACSYFGYNATSYSSFIKEVHKHLRERI